MFFAGVGMCADLRMLKQGGKALVLFLMVLLPFIIVQNVVGVSSRSSWTCIRSSVWSAAPSRWSADTEPAPPMPSALPSQQPSGGDGTVNDGRHVGLIIGGIIAGPVAEYLIKRYDLRSQAVAGATTSRAEEAVRSARSEWSARWRNPGRRGSAVGWEQILRWSDHDPLVPMVHGAGRGDPQSGAVYRHRFDDRASA